MLVMTDRREGLAEAGRWLRECREQAGLTQQQLADSFGGKTQNVSAYELGVHRPSDDKAAAMATCLDIPLAEMRSRFGLYVPPGPIEETPVDVLGAIRRDPHLIPEARKHLLSQYQLLRRLGDPAQGDRPGADILKLPHAARTRSPRKPRD